MYTQHTHVDAFAAKPSPNSEVGDPTEDRTSCLCAQINNNNNNGNNINDTSSNRMNNSNDTNILDIDL